MSEYQLTVGAETQVVTDEQLESWDRAVRSGAPMPPFAVEAVRLWKEHGADGNITIRNGKARWRDDDGPISQNFMLPSRPAPAVRPSVTLKPSGAVSMATKVNNALWFHTITGTGTQAAQEVKPNDPIELSDLDFETNDATAVISSIKQGSTELLAGSGAGVLASKWTVSFYRALFAGLVVTRENPLTFVVTHAGSGTNTTTAKLIGFKTKNAGCSIAN
jgi:hypothetical protein